MRPLDNVTVLDFSTLLPGPLAGLILARAGARVIKIERPKTGDEMRSYKPSFDKFSVNFALLNEGKESIEIDLKSDDARARLKPLIENADILIEQFRPGVMDRMGLGYAELKRINPRLIYCSITGWGQSGPKAMVAAHDLNYMAEAGILGLSSGSDGAPIVPPVLAADIAAGAYPAIINILLALRNRETTREGTYLDIAMGENLLTFAYWGLGNGFAADEWPGGGDALVTGGSPRYQIYETADRRYIAAAPLEDRFWTNFCDVIGLPEELRPPSAHQATVIDAVASIIETRSALQWMQAFADRDVCCSIVASLKEAAEDPHFAARKILARMMTVDGKSIPTLPLPVVGIFADSTAGSPPRLGANTSALLNIQG
jgi:crotonobetainyl-CoA:carnitine CoA-transferase CaiB-like acyl-CoA transferase